MRVPCCLAAGFGLWLASYAVSVETFAFLFTDIEGSTALVGRLGEGLYAQVLANHQSLIRSGLAAHDGRVVDTQGDALFAVFSSPRACLAAAVEIQRAVAALAWPDGERVRARIGVHAGETAKTAARLPGLEVHRAARVAAVGHGGQILVSETAAALVRGALPAGASLADLGVHRLTDLGRPERIFQLRTAGLQAQFPPLRSLDNPALANNLPAKLASFIGRARELAEVRAMAGSSRLVTLTGAGAPGKTRLGLQLAAGLLDGSGDGVWLVELAAVGGEDAVAWAISQALGLAAQPGRPVLEAVLDALAPQEMLIVLDSCEHLIGGCAKTAEAILRRCPRVHLLATSREPLGIGGETIYRVPPLSLPGPGSDDLAAAESSDAVALFVDRAHGTSLSLDEITAPLVVSICRRLDGLPLAIELVAAQLRSLSVSDLAGRLDQRFRLLTRGDRTALARQQTLEATVEWSYSLLSAAEQLLLRRLSVFAESLDLDAAEAVCGFGGIGLFQITGLLASLVDKSLVVAQPADAALRYRLPETIRQFAAEQLTQAGDDQAAALKETHCAHYLSLAETAAPHLTGPDQGSWLARLDSDQPNLRRAAEHAASRPARTAQVLRLGVALRRYWRARTREQEALALLLPVLDRPEARADPQLFGTALVTAALAARHVDMALARQLGEQAVTLARQLDAARLLIESLNALSYIYYLADEPERGLPPGQEAVQRARQLGDDVLLGESLTQYLLCHDLVGPAHARTLFTEAIACTQRSGDHLVACFLLNIAGVHALRAGNIPAARAYLQQAQARWAIGDENRHLSINMGWMLRQDNDPDDAQSSFEAALRRSHRNGDCYGIAYASLGLACLAADAGDWHRAAVLHGVAQAFLDQTGLPWEELEAPYRWDSLDQVRAHLGQEHSERAYARGMALSSDDALTLASGKAPPPDLLPLHNCPLCALSGANRSRPMTIQIGGSRARGLIAACCPAWIDPERAGRQDRRRGNRGSHRRE
jgi:predicted ATPase/class 3 adenylate cyclase